VDTSVSLGDYFEEFAREQISSRRYKNISEVIRAGLRLLEEEEYKVKAIKLSIKEGWDSSTVEDFDF